MQVSVWGWFFFDKCMKTTYKSKVDTWLVCLVAVIMCISMLPLLIYDFSWTGFILTVLVSVLIFYCIFSIRYIIEGNTLTVKCAIFVKMHYKIDTIREIKDTQTLISSPAASLDRIAIYFYKKYTPLIISPKQKKDFIDKLKSINHNIIHSFWCIYKILSLKQTFI